VDMHFIKKCGCGVFHGLAFFYRYKRLSKTHTKFLLF
jgi:hypothetical protein